MLRCAAVRPLRPSMAAAALPTSPPRLPVDTAAVTGTGKVAAHW